jgi:hypothetical protein
MHDAVFTRTYALPSGPRVRLRLAGLRDRATVEALLRERGITADDTAVHRLLRVKPAERLVLAAFAPVDGAERLVGIGAIDLAPGCDVDTLVVDERLTDGLGTLLGDVLRGRAAAHGRRVA